MTCSTYPLINAGIVDSQQDPNIPISKLSFYLPSSLPALPKQSIAEIAKNTLNQQIRGSIIHPLLSPSLENLKHEP